MCITTSLSLVEILLVSKWHVVYSADGLHLVEAVKLVRCSSF